MRVVSFLLTGKMASEVLTFSQTEGDSEESTTSSEADTEAQPSRLLVLGAEEVRPQPYLFVREELLIRAFPG